jgi:geranylgeranyl diphosphate synthase type I
VAVRASSQTTATLGERVDDVLRGFLAERRDEMAGLDEDAAGAVDEIARLIDAGGKRLRPAMCYWGYRAGGGDDGEPIVRAAAALELLHTMALVHDDLIDAAAERRGVETSHVRLARIAGSAASGRAGALLVGDLAAVFADRLFLESGFPSEILTRALARYHRMRSAMAAGQWLELFGGAPADHAAVLVRATLRGGSYSVEGPLVIGGTLAGAPSQIVAALERFGEPLGRAFQLRDDLEDGEAGGITAEDVDALVDSSLRALESLAPDPREALTAIARQVALS